ncbi:MAG: DsrE family protein [Sphingobacteriaceae bacterium]|jgi:intracellular sulfur oxidation DsrE/DsrF family protein|nr:DsrE family protein [Sphingobacteriaceae bacterium]
MKKLFKLATLLSLFSSVAFAQGTASAYDKMNSDDLVSAHKHYKLVFNLERDAGVYNNSNTMGLSYAKNMIQTCEKYHAVCDIYVVIHDKAYPLAVKTANLNHRELNHGVNYNYSGDVAYLVKHGVYVITSRSSLDRHHLNQQDLLPGVKLADSATLFLASKASEGYLIINQ